MKILTEQSKALYSKNKWLVFVGLVIALVGFLDATYLTLKHFRREIPPCSIAEGCEQVLTSKYATLGPIPVALGGSVYYVVILLGLIAYLDSKNEKLLKVVSLATIAGLAASAYFFFLQAVIIKYWCQYCVGSIISSSLLFIIGMILLRRLQPPTQA